MGGGKKKKLAVVGAKRSRNHQTPPEPSGSSHFPGVRPFFSPIPPFWDASSHSQPCPQGGNRPGTQKPGGHPELPHIPGDAGTFPAARGSISRDKRSLSTAIPDCPGEVLIKAAPGSAPGRDLRGFNYSANCAVISAGSRLFLLPGSARIPLQGESRDGMLPSPHQPEPNAGFPRGSGNGKTHPIPNFGAPPLL